MDPATAALVGSFCPSGTATTLPRPLPVLGGPGGVVTRPGETVGIELEAADPLSTVLAGEANPNAKSPELTPLNVPVVASKLCNNALCSGVNPRFVELEEEEEGEVD